MKREREALLQAWLCKQFLQSSIALHPLSGDAGFRCYYRFTLNSINYIAVDAPKDTSNNEAFVQIQKMLLGMKVNVPKIIFSNLEQGFLCLTDLGECLLSDVVSTNPPLYYQKAIELLPQIAIAHRQNHETLPLYDVALLQREVGIFEEWLLNTHLNIYLTESESHALSDAYKVLINNALEQPQVFVHRDYHSRNIMSLAEGELAVIDFQDAVIGPITYDIVSLLRDCYVRWPEDDVKTLFADFCTRMQAHKYLKLNTIEPNQWQRWFDLMGVQRHIKASGIFARLHHRDNKAHYLNDIPLTLSYLVDVCAQYPELEIIYTLVKHKVLPALSTLESVK